MVWTGLAGRWGAGGAEALGVLALPPGVLPAGSRSGVLPDGFRLLVGSARCVDRSFRLALARQRLGGRSLVAYVSRERLRCACGLPAAVVVPEGLGIAAALCRRAVRVATRCSVVVLFPGGGGPELEPGLAAGVAHGRGTRQAGVCHVRHGAVRSGIRADRAWALVRHSVRMVGRLGRPPRQGLVRRGGLT